MERGGPDASDGPGDRAVQHTGGMAETSTFRTRAFTFPAPGDTLQAMAGRLLPDAPDGAAVLLGWNPHLAVRADRSPDGLVLLSTDIIYTEPPS